MESRAIASCYKCGQALHERAIGRLCGSCLAGGFLASLRDSKPDLEARLPRDGFKVLSQIARGGMSTVVKAKDLRSGKYVAVKVTRPDFENRRSARLRLLSEASILARLDHPFIVPLLDCGEDREGMVYLVTRFVPGRNLHEILQGLRAGDRDLLVEFPLLRLLEVFQEICRATQYAHGQGVIHRDIKPENVIVGDDGVACLIDWGIARRDSGGAGDAAGANRSEDPDESTVRRFRLLTKLDLLTSHGDVLGTPQFMSPEQANGDLAIVDERSDVYSLGALLFMILTLRPSVRGRTVDEILEQVKNGDIRAPDHFNPTNLGKRLRGIATGDLTTMSLRGASGLRHLPNGRIPESLSRLTERAMATNRANRLASVDDLLGGVSSYLRGDTLGR